MEYYTDIVYKQPNQRAWVTYIRGKVLTENNSFPSLVVGKTGSGKSYGTLRLCDELSPDFQLDGNWYFRAEEFMRDFTRYYKNRETSKRGKIWVLDEAGVDLNSLKYQNNINKAYSSLFQTSRFRNYIFFGTVPFMDFISKQVRKLMHHRMDAHGVENGKTVIVPRCLEWNEKKEDFYYKRLICKYPDGEQKKINRMLLPLVRKSLRVEYEKRRAEFSDAVNAELVSDAFGDDTNKKVLSKDYEDVLVYKKQNLKLIEIAEKLQVKTARISQIVNKLKKMGYDFSHTKKGASVYYPDIKEWVLYPKETKSLNSSQIEKE